MIKQFYSQSNKINLIPRGVDIERFKSQPYKNEVFSQMNSNENQRIIICVANMVPVKGIELLIDAFNNLQSHFEQWNLWLIGDIENEYGIKLIEKVSQLQHNNRIHFSGKQPNVREYLDCAEIFVLPTKDEGRREGSPVAMLEAMANGKVVVGSAVPGVNDQLRDFPDFLFEAGNASDLEKKLKPLLQNSKDENIELGAQFSQLVNTNFRIDQEVKKHEVFYQKVLEID